MSFLVKALAVSAGQILGNFLSMVAGILLARTLGPSGIGQFEVFRSFDAIIVTIFCLGIGNASMYFINNRGVDPAILLATTLRTCWLIAFLLAITIGFAVRLFPNYFGTVSGKVTAMYIVGSATSLHLLSLKTILTAKLSSRRLILVDQMPRVVLVTLVSCALFAGKLTFSVAIVSIAVGNLLSLSLLIYFLKNEIHLWIPFSLPLLKQLIGYGLKLSGCDLLFVLNASIPVLLLKQFMTGNFSQVGYYSRAVAISSLVSMIPYTLGPLLYARLSSLKGENLLARSQFAIRVGIFFSVGISIVVYFSRKIIVLVLYGQEFLESAMAIQVLAPSLIFFSISNVCMNLLSSQGKAAMNVKILIGTFTTICLVGSLSIPHFGIQGAALAVLCGNVFTALLSLYFCRHIFGLGLFESLIVRKDDLLSLARPLRRRMLNYSR